MNSTTQAKFSIPSIVAIIAGIASFSAGAFAGFLLALVAVGFGVAGIMLAFLPRRRGGMVSVLAVIAGALGVIAAVVKGVAWLL
jgi:hypothetical protein